MKGEKGRNAQTAKSEKDKSEVVKGTKGQGPQVTSHKSQVTTAKAQRAKDTES